MDFNVEAESIETTLYGDDIIRKGHVSPCYCYQGGELIDGKLVGAKLVEVVSPDKCIEQMKAMSEERFTMKQKPEPIVATFNVEGIRFNKTTGRVFKTSGLLHMYMDGPKIILTDDTQKGIQIKNLNSLGTAAKDMIRTFLKASGRYYVVGERTRRGVEFDTRFKAFYTGREKPWMKEMYGGILIGKEEKVAG